MPSSETQFKSSIRGGKRGTRRKMPAEMKRIIRGAFDAAGGFEYIARYADQNPVAFMAMLGKLIIREVRADVQWTALKLCWM